MTSPIQKCCSWFSCCWVEVEKCPPRTVGYGTFLGLVEADDAVVSPEPKEVLASGEMVDVSLQD